MRLPARRLEAGLAAEHAECTLPREYRCSPPPYMRAQPNQPSIHPPALSPSHTPTTRPCSIKTVRFLHKLVEEAGFRAALLHGERSQDEREAAVADFRSGKAQV